MKLCTDYGILNIKKGTCCNRCPTGTHSKGGASQAGYLPLNERRPSWLRQGGHYFFRLCSLSLSRKASNAITKLPKAISKSIIPINIKMISAAVIGATSLPMYSGNPVIGSGGYHPCHGFHIGILPQSYRNFNQILFSWNMWKVFKYESQNNLTKQKERPKSTDFPYFSV